MWCSTPELVDWHDNPRAEIHAQGFWGSGDHEIPTMWCSTPELVDWHDNPKAEIHEQGFWGSGDHEFMWCSTPLTGTTATN